VLALDFTQQSILAQTTTTPTYLVDIEWGGQRRWSTRADHTVAGITYTGGEIGVRGAQDWRTADLSLNPSAANTAILMSGSWRGAACTIRLLPFREHAQLVEEGYAEEGYGFFGDEIADPILLLDGEVTSAGYSGNGAITLGVRHVGSITRPAPRTRIGPPAFNHLPTPGTKFTWAGEVYILDSR
jgi:hypothetical protein